MRTIFHLGMSVRGALSGGDSKLKNLLGAITVDGKKLVRIKSIRKFLESCLAEGKEVLPYSECDNWDWAKGCQGHPEPETEETNS